MSPAIDKGMAINDEDMEEGTHIFKVTVLHLHQNEEYNKVILTHTMWLKHKLAISNKSQSVPANLLGVMKVDI
jgi:hypothetical protein